MTISCPHCGVSYTAKDCQTNFSKATTVVCSCGCQMEVVPRFKGWMHWFGRLGVNVKARTRED